MWLVYFTKVEVPEFLEGQEVYGWASVARDAPVLDKRMSGWLYTEKKGTIAAEIDPNSFPLDISFKMTPELYVAKSSMMPLEMVLKERVEGLDESMLTGSIFSSDANVQWKRYRADIDFFEIRAEEIGFPQSLSEAEFLPMDQYSIISAELNGRSVLLRKTENGAWEVEGDESQLTDGLVSVKGKSIAEIAIQK